VIEAQVSCALAERTRLAPDYGFEIHQAANVSAIYRNWNIFRNGRPPDKELKLKALNDGTVWADATEHQDGEDAYMHAMRNRKTKQTPEEAMKAADDWVRERFAQAKKLLKDGKTYEAYFEFGKGLHPLQDATSPSHAGFQQWGGDESPAELIEHVIRELFYPGKDSNLQSITNQYLDWFENNQNLPLSITNLFSGIKSD
jgi:hypothetical protein